MADKKDDLTSVYGSNLQARKYLYETGLQNVFNDYEKKIASLDEAKQKSIEDAYYTRELSKKYLGEYASNTGIGDVSGELLDLYGSYQKNRFDIDRHYDTLKQNYDLEYGELKRGYETDLFMTNWAIEQEQKTYEQLENYNEALIKLNNDDTDGLSRMEYINSIKDKIPIDKYYELIFGEQERSYLEKEQDDNLDLVIRLAEGNYGANPDDFFKSLYKKGIIEADGLVNYFRGKSEDLVADALEEMNNGASFERVASEYGLNEGQRQMLKSSYNASKEITKMAEFVKDMTAGKLSDEEIIQGFKSGYIDTSGLLSYFEKTNKFDDANAILKIANMKTDKEFNDYIKAQGLKGTQREKMLKSLYDAEKTKRKQQEVITTIATGNVEDLPQYIKDNQMYLGEQFPELLAGALTKQYGDYASSMMKNASKYNSKNDWANYVDSELLKGNIGYAEKNSLLEYWEMKDIVDITNSTENLDLSGYYNVDEFKENGKQFKNSKGEVWVESNDIVDSETDYYEELNKRNLATGNNVVAFNGHLYYRNPNGDFIPLVKAHKVRIITKDDELFKPTANNVLDDEGNQVAPTISYSNAQGNTTTDTVYYNKEKEQFDIEVSATFVPGPNFVNYYPSEKDDPNSSLVKFEEKRGNLKDGKILINNEEYIVDGTKESNVFYKEAKQKLADKYFNGKENELNDYIEQNNKSLERYNKISVFKYNDKYIAIYCGYAFDLKKK